MTLTFQKLTRDYNDGTGPHPFKTCIRNAREFYYVCIKCGKLFTHHKEGRIAPHCGRCINGCWHNGATAVDVMKMLDIRLMDLFLLAGAAKKSACPTAQIGSYLPEYRRTLPR